MALNFPSNPQPNDQYTGDNGITYIYDGDKWVGRAPTLAPGTNAIVNGNNVVQVDPQGNLVIPVGATIVDANGALAVSSDRLVNGSNEIVLNASGALVYPNSALQRDTATVNCPGNASTVVYTASGQYQHTIKLLIQVEGFVGANTVYDTQACEMIIAKSFRANAIAASVYGVVHTSLAPLATFTVTWNALASRVEVLCTTPSANTVNVRTFATEITTSD